FGSGPLPPGARPVPRGGRSLSADAERASAPWQCARELAHGAERAREVELSLAPAPSLESRRERRWPRWKEDPMGGAWAGAYVGDVDDFGLGREGVGHLSGGGICDFNDLRGRPPSL